MTGTVVEVDATLAGRDEKDPCSRFPCMATVRIDSVIGYGSAFPASLGAGSTMRVRFMFTLNATKEIFPDVKPALPGLHKGSRFTADVTGTPALGKDTPEFSINIYQVH